ncbi:MAG TPA: hypothetical protein VG674_29725 [Amycolatopsis sp.]|nr:hypothetical protein [Amycolatopsis sp.]
MRNPGHLLLRSALRSARPATLVVLPAVLLLTGSETALADDNVAREETAWAGFGMLGPVGLVAVALGIVGMALGVLRQRRKARAAIETPAPAEARAAIERPTPAAARAATETSAPARVRAAIERPTPAGARAAVVPELDADEPTRPLAPVRNP